MGASHKTQDARNASGVLVTNRSYHRDKLEGVRWNIQSICIPRRLNESCAWNRFPYRLARMVAQLVTRVSNPRLNRDKPEWGQAIRRRTRATHRAFWLPIAATIETSSKVCNCIPRRLVRVVAKIGYQKHRKKNSRIKFRQSTSPAT